MEKKNLKNYLPFLILAILASLPKTACPKGNNDVLENLEKEISRLIDIAKPSVVSITSKSMCSYTVSRDGGFLPFLIDKKEKRTIYFKNVGSGLILDKEGYIITKSSVVPDVRDIQVTLHNGKNYPAKFVGEDVETGLVILKIDAHGLMPAKLGNSDSLTIGSWITIIGNSLGISPSVSFGLVNGVRKDGLIQLSANVNPGNSGSPVFNIKGEVVGIVAARLNAGDGFTGLALGTYFSESGLAFPVNRLRNVAEKIIASSRIQKGWLGITAEERLVDGSAYPITHVVEVTKGGPAHTGGLKSGDIIRKYNNQIVKDYKELKKLVENTKPGTVVKVELERNNREIITEVVIGNRADARHLSLKSPRYFMNYKEYYKEYYNMTVPSYNRNFPAHTEIYQLRQKIQNLEVEVIKLKSLLNKRDKLPQRRE